jgi:hypothetical protein
MLRQVKSRPKAALKFKPDDRGIKPPSTRGFDFRRTVVPKIFFLGALVLACIIFRRRVHKLALLFNRDSNYPGLHHTKCTGSAKRDIDDSPSNERATIIDEAADCMTSVRNRHDASERSGAMSARHFAMVTKSAIVGG